MQANLAIMFLRSLLTCTTPWWRRAPEKSAVKTLHYARRRVKEMRLPIATWAVTKRIVQNISLSLKSGNSCNCGNYMHNAHQHDCANESSMNQGKNSKWFVTIPVAEERDVQGARHLCVRHVAEPSLACSGSQRWRNLRLQIKKI